MLDAFWTDKYDNLFNLPYTATQLWQDSIVLKLYYTKNNEDLGKV